jgi:hypothetical protein
MSDRVRIGPLAGAAFALSLGAAGQAMAWGATGHRMIGQLGIETLPASVPAFLRAPGVAENVGELAREPDRSKGAGKVHDNMRDPGHFVDVDDEGKVLGGPALAALPATKTDYDAALRALGTDSAKAGFLSYSIVDGWQQLTKDFAYWRAEAAGLRLEKDPVKRAWIERDQKRREAQTIQDLGVWAHYVGDGSQPLHVSVHYNGWGPGPNPEGFTQQRVHGPFEGQFVLANVTKEMARSKMPAPGPDCRCDIEQRTSAYLNQTFGFVLPFYRLEKAGGFMGSDPRGASFATERVAAGAAELRDLIVAAWEASANGQVGYPSTPISQIETGQADVYTLLYGDD